MSSLIERSPGVWRVRVFLPPTLGYPKGRQVSKTFRGGKRTVRAEANAWERELRATPSDAVGTTVRGLLDMWQNAKRSDWQPTTVRDVRGRCDRIAAELGGLRVSDLDPIQVDAWVAQMRRDGAGEGAIRGRVQTLRSALSWGVTRRLLRSNPVSEARPRVAAGRRTKRPESEQVVALIAAASGESRRAGLALRLAAVTGARAAEVVALRWDDLNGDRLLIGRQRHSADGEVLIRDQTKTGGSRRVVLDAGTVGAIGGWHEEADAMAGAPTDWMLAEAGGSNPPSPRWLYEVFLRAASTAGVPTGRQHGLVLHDLRHWAASTALRDGHDPVTVAARLGHSPETLLRVYAQEIDDGQADVASSLASRLDP